jgi:hypothetical protein
MAYGVRGTLGLAVLGLACSAGGGETAPPDRPADREAIQAAVVRYQYRQFLKDPDAPAAAVCLSVLIGDEMGDPSDRLLRRLRDLPGIRRDSECESRGDDVVVRGTDVPAVRLTVGAITWKGDDDVQVAATYHRGRFSSARPTYRVVRERGGWISLGPTMRIDVA